MWARLTELQAKSPANNEPVSCDLCEEATATKYCPQCNQKLCVTCHKMHSRAATSKNHQTRDLQPKDHLDSEDKEQPCHCSKHGAPLNAIHVHENRLLCPYCIVTEKIDPNDYQSLEEVSEAKKAELNNIRQELTNYVEVIRTTKQNMKKIKKSQSHKTQAERKEAAKKVQRVWTPKHFTENTTQNTTHSENTTQNTTHGDSYTPPAHRWQRRSISWNK